MNRYQIFLKVLALGSFTKAAEELGYEIEIDETVQVEDAKPRKSEAEQTEEAVVDAIEAADPAAEVVETDVVETPEAEAVVVTDEPADAEAAE